ncbi:geraniol 8-hydroxylase-like protein [Tanacetum coccineum]|uniref:Geraniol 8-hydroxylase-like protein n=1 Tax=Tanacetum coccineum TaxID=301880 RepID=A0ABQ5G245_9ASTR
MDYSILYLLFSFLVTLIYGSTIFNHHKSRLPPGPYPLPIIGNLLKLSDKPHRSLATLSKRYGPLMSLKLGSITTIVVSSPDMVKEFFQTHDQMFSGRSIPTSMHAMDQADSIVLLPAGDEWRRLRRITKEYLFSGQRLVRSERLRGEKVQELLDHITQCCANKKVVNVGEVAFTTSLNILSNLLFSTDLSGYDTTSSQEYRDVVTRATEVSGKPNLVDFFPPLKPLDPQGLVREATIVGNKLHTMFDKIICLRLQTRVRSSSLDTVPLAKNDLLDALLDIHLKDDSQFTKTNINHLCFDLFVAGTDTTSTTLEWAMSELIHNPKKMKTARLELAKLMQNENTNIEEHDISRLPYLQAIIKETLRLHPPVPFFIPHQALRDVEVQGFIVPKKAQILCNLWAIGQDPNVWSDAEKFMPERFLDVKIDYRGQDFEFTPFGIGRRMCPGLNIAHRMLHIMLGSLILKFDWKLEGNMRVKDLDMSEKFGLTLPRNEPLLAIPIKP